MPGEYLKKRIARAVKRTIRSLLKSTAPYWGPPVLLIFLAYSAYIILFEVPKEALADTATSALTKVEAFLGITEDPNAGSTANSKLLGKYKQISNTWNSGLTPEQISQVQAYKFPYSVLMAVDRVVNDNAVWEGKTNVEPQPQKVFDVLKPKFSWKDSTITIVTTVKLPIGETTTSTTTQHVSLITQADTFEGTFKYQYEWKTTTSGNTTISREEVKQTIPPAVLNVPLKDYLRINRGITDQDTFEMVANLAMSYDPEYQFNFGLQNGGQNYETKPAYSLAYADEVQQLLSQHPNVPQTLFLALIAHESGGNWQSLNTQNTNGTTDAGLCQINSVNWATYGLTSNPYDVDRNIDAGASILGRALNQYNDITQALYAYNGGTPVNGQFYNPSYAPQVMAIFTQLQSTPAFAVYIPTVAGQPLTILAAEQNGSSWEAYGQSGKRFTNPAEITVVNERTGETQKVKRTSGDGTMWAAQAWVYHPSLKDVQKGDTLNVKFEDGENVEIKDTK